MVLVGGGNGDYVFAAPRPAGQVAALDAATGDVLWTRRTDDAVLGAIAAAWTRRKSGPDSAPPLPVRDRTQTGQSSRRAGIGTGSCLLLCPVRNGELLALDGLDGRILWRQRISGSAPLLAGPVLASDRVFAVSRDGLLAVLDASDGRIIEKHYVNDPSEPGGLGLTISSPTVAAGRVVLGSETGGVRCYVGTAGEARRE